MTHINFVWMIDFDHFPWAVSDMIRRSVGSVEVLPGGTSSPSIYLGHKWARTIFAWRHKQPFYLFRPQMGEDHTKTSKAFKAYLPHVELIRYA